MTITIDLSQTLSDQLQRVKDIDGFVEAAVRREFNRQHSVQKIQNLAQTISRRPEASALSSEELSQLLNDI